MKLKKGLYEQVINEGLDREIKRNIENVEVYKEVMNKKSSNIILSKYLSHILEKGLNYFSSSEDGIFKQIEIVNNMIELFSKLVEDEEFEDYKVKLDQKNILKGIYEKEKINKNLEAYHPITSIARSSLFTGAYSEPTVFSELNKEIRTADRVDLLVSFIKFSGLRLIMDSLREHTKTKRLRVITTSYMGASDFKAIKMLSELPNTEVKISYDTKRTRLHAKAYYFHRETGFSTAYIGSSNLSKAALSEGTEWNLKISEYTSDEIIEKYKRTFEVYWNTEEFKRFDSSRIEDIKILKESLKRGGLRDDYNFSFDITPYGYQQEILDSLEVEREIHKSNRNLVVSATGTGKTVVAAFDFKRHYRKNPNSRVLFLAHRKEILKQSVMTFRWILKDQNFGDLWVGENTPTEDNHLFASVQTLNSKENYLRFKKDYFDYIVLDETHHGAAVSYDKLLKYFEPKILLGLTATPERMDGIDILSYFNNRIAHEIRLHEAIERKLLCPFHYFGITDNTNLESIKWSRGRYDQLELSNLYTGNDKRAELIYDSVLEHVTDIDKVKGIGFCVSREHAKYMRDCFDKRGVKSISLDSNSSIEERNTAKQKLEKGEIKFIFVVDLYNEGVDIPSINTVLFLRPTESVTIFVQQLGRGLRIHEDKEVLTVLDFVGQANKQFDYRNKLRSLVGKTNSSMEDEIQNEFPTLPSGCFIMLERKAKEYILKNIKETYANKNNLRKMIRNYKFETDRELSLSSFINHYRLNISQIYKSTSFYELCSLENLKDGYEIKNEKELKNAFKRILHINSKKWIDFIIFYLKLEFYQFEVLGEEEKLMALMFHYSVWNEAPKGAIDEYFYRLRDDRYVFDEILELLEYNRSKISFIEKDIDLKYTCPLELYSRYTTDQILAAVGKHTEDKKHSFREGVLYIEEKNTDMFFITLHKSEKLFSETTRYEDYAISEKLFHWQSQSRTSDTSKKGQRYINQRKNKTITLLFVREYKKENGITSPYHFLGKANYVSHKGSKPISIKWELEQEMPVFIQKKTNKAVKVM